MKKNKTNEVLGMGLEALIPKYQTEDQIEKYFDHVKISLIVPNKNQPRQIFLDEGMDELIDSIKNNGIIQPLAVRELKNGKYELISGERRFRAAKINKFKTVPAYIIKVVSDDEMLKLALIENIQRENLSSMEEAEGYALLRGKYEISEANIAKQVGKNRSTIANKMRLIKLPPDLKNALRIKDPDFTEGHARAILGLRESKKMKNLFRRIKRDKLSVRDTEKLVKGMKEGLKTQDSKKIVKNNYFSNYEDSLIQCLGTKVVINKNRSNGKINIYFSNNEDLERVINLILNEE